MSNPADKPKEPYGSDLTDAVLIGQVFELQRAVAELQSHVRALDKEVARLAGLRLQT